MKSTDIHTLRKGDLEIVIVDGYPSSLTFDSSGVVYQIFHTGGLPSDHDLREPEVNDFSKWSNRSGETMFPVVGPVKDEKIVLNGREYSQPKHGFSDIIGHSFTREERRGLLYTYAQDYKGEVVKTEKGSFSFVPYKMVRKFSIEDDSVFSNTLLQETLIINNSDKTLRYMYGEHFSFKSPEDPKNGKFMIEGEERPLFDLSKVIKDSKKWATVRKNATSVVYLDLERNIGVNLLSNFGGMMFWSPGPFFAIEPITNPPVRVEKQEYFGIGNPCQKLGPKNYTLRYVKITPFSL